MKRVPKIRILGGVFKGRALRFGYHTKPAPTQAIIRKSVFDQLGMRIRSGSFLDGFAGSGSMGIEALSRGAKEVVFIENDRKLVESLEDNLRHLGVLQVFGALEPSEISGSSGLSSAAAVSHTTIPQIHSKTSDDSHTMSEGALGLGVGEVWRGHFERSILELRRSFDVIFLDPPYELFAEERTLRRILRGIREKNLIKADGRIIVERSQRYARRHEGSAKKWANFEAFLAKLNFERSDIRSFGRTQLETYVCASLIQEKS